MQRLGFDQPWEQQPERAARLGDRPAQRVDLQALQQVLGPVRQHHDHEHPQRQLVAVAIQTVEDGAARDDAVSRCGCRLHSWEPLPVILPEPSGGLSPQRRQIFPSAKTPPNAEIARTTWLAVRCGGG